MFELALGGHPVAITEDEEGGGAARERARRPFAAEVTSAGAALARRAEAGLRAARGAVERRLFGGNAGGGGVGGGSEGDAARGSDGVVRGGPGGSSRASSAASSRGVPGIEHAAALGLLLRLTARCPDAETRAGALELLLRLVEGAPANARALGEQSEWREWLLPGLRPGEGRGGARAHVPNLQGGAPAVRDPRGRDQGRRRGVR